MPYIVDVQTAFPDYYYTQDELITALKKIMGNNPAQNKLIDRINENLFIKGRNTVLPLEQYFSVDSFDQKNSHFITNAIDLSTKAVESVLLNNKLSPHQIKSLWSNTVTGFAIPSIEARLMNKISFSSNTKRVPILGLGCMAGIAGINRVADYLKGHPQEAAIFFSVELCSLTIQTENINAATIISNALFGDGAAAVLMVGDDHPLSKSAKLKWLASESVFFPGTETVMGWDVGSKGLKVILDKSVPQITKNFLPKPLENFLNRQSISLGEIKSLLAHPGGPKVLEALCDVLKEAPADLGHSWESLKQNGNMSSVSVLDIINRSIKESHPQQEYALAIAMGPSFSAEFGLLQWQ